jgi:transcriptional regulator with XRE-family HTH domain
MEARGPKIRRLREEAGYGLNQFASRIGISPSWLSRIERNKAKRPGPDVLKRIANGVEHPVADIATFGEEETK